MSQESVVRDAKRPVATRKRPEADSELADVVVSGVPTGQEDRPWYLALRSWFFCLGFLLLLEIGTRLYYDTGLSLRKERFDNFPTPASQNAFIAQMQRDTAYKIAIVGDSTVVGGALLGRQESMPRYLEGALQAARPNRPIHVWNFGLAGARASDMLCLLKKVEEGHPDFVIVNGNYFITVQGIIQTPIAEPWLARTIKDVPPSIQRILPVRTNPQKIEAILTDAVEEKIRFIGLRQSINARLFGVQPREPFAVANPFVMELVTLMKQRHRLKPTVWSQRVPVQRPPDYRQKFAGDITPQDPNGQFQREIMQEILHSGLPAMTYITPQNPAITSYCLPRDLYLQRRQVLSSFFAAPGVPHKDLSDLIPEYLFTDNDHMLAEGNRRLAEVIAQEILPRIPN